MTSKPKLIGYTILDQGRPIRDAGRTHRWRYHSELYSTTPVALYPTLKEAHMAKRAVREQYNALGEECAPNGGWQRRMHELRIRRVAVVEA